MRSVVVGDADKEAEIEEEIVGFKDADADIDSVSSPVVCDIVGSSEADDERD